MSTPLVAPCLKTSPVTTVPVTTVPVTTVFFRHRRMVQSFALLVFFGAAACEAESPVDGFTLFLEAVQNHQTQETFARLSPESRAQVELSLAKYVMAHPEKHMPPAEYLFHEGELDRLGFGVKKIEVVVVKGPWAQLAVETIEGDLLQVVMQKRSKKWTFHFAPPPSFLPLGESY